MAVTFNALTSGSSRAETMRDVAAVMVSNPAWAAARCTKVSRAASRSRPLTSAASPGWLAVPGATEIVARYRLSGGEMNTAILTSARTMSAITIPASTIRRWRSTALM
jgi:hypothetical protein